MSSPKKPRSAATPKPAPAAPLTADQQLLLNYYSQIDDEGLSSTFCG